MEPTTTAAGGYLFSKGAAALSALFGGLSVSFFYQPSKLHEHGKLAAGAIVGGISVGAGFMLGGIAAKSMGMNFEDIDVALGLGYVIGMLSVGLIAWVANFLEKREKKDLLEVFDEVKGKAKPEPVKKVTRRVRAGVKK